MAKGDNLTRPSSPISPRSSTGDVNDKKKEKLVSNVKGNPSPPRFTTEEQQPPLPPYAITWTAAAVCVETAGPVLDLHRLVEEANQKSRPAMSFSIVDAQELVDEELADEESTLRVALLEAKEGPKEDSKGSRKDTRDADKKGNLKDKVKGKDKEKKKEKEKGKGKEKGQGQGQVGSWLQPKHLHELLAGRQARDRDFEHRGEAVRRGAEVEEAKRKAEETKKAVESKDAALAAAKKSLQEFEERDRKRIREAWWAEKAAAALAAKTGSSATPGNNGGNKVPKAGKATKSDGKSPPPKDASAPLKGKDKIKDKKGAVAATPDLSPQEERLSCQEAVRLCTAALEAAEAQVVEADKNVSQLEAAINDAFTTNKIYCCLGFGDTADSLGELAASRDNIFCAILNVAKKAPPASIPLQVLQSPQTGSSPGSAGTKGKGATTKDAPKETNGETATKPSDKGMKQPKDKVERINDPPVPPLVAGMRTAAAASHIKSPLRKVLVMDVLWEERKQEEILPSDSDQRPKSAGKKEKNSAGKKDKEEKGLEKRPGSPPDKKGKGAKGEGGLPYTEIAEALATSCITLMQQVNEFKSMDADTCFVDIPDAIPRQDVKMDHYKHLLDEVPPELVSVPIIIHCMMEQVAMVVCEEKDVEAMEAANQRKVARVVLEQAFLNLGKRMELPYHSPFGNVFLPPEFEYEEMEVPPHASQGVLVNCILLTSMESQCQKPSGAGQGRRDFPTPPSYPLEKRGTCMTALRKFSKLLFPSVQRYRKLRHIADLLLNRKVETIPTNAFAIKDGQGPDESGEGCTTINSTDTSLNPGGDCKPAHSVRNTTPGVESEGRKSLFQSSDLDPNSEDESSVAGCTDDGKWKLSSSNKIHVPGSDDEERHIRPSRFTQTDHLKYLPEKPPAIEPAFDQSKLRPHETVLSCRFVDAFPDDTFAEAYSKARLALPFERMVYDKDEDFVISVLFAEGGEHNWASHVPSLIPFGRFCSDPTASIKRKADFAASQPGFMRPTAYGIEDADGCLTEKKHIFLGANDSLVCNGLPMQTKPECSVCHKPQATMYKDGSTFLLRGDPATADESATLENTLTACLKDGLTMCFYIAKDRTINVQVTHPTGKTFELTSNGIVLIFPTTLKEQEKAAEKKDDAAAQSVAVKQEVADKVAEAGLKKGGKKGAKGESKDVEPPDVKKTTKLEAKSDLTNKDGKGKSETKGKDKKGAKASIPELPPGDPPKALEQDDHHNNVKCISDILQKERGEEELWRCVLPSGTVVRYRENKEMQLLFSNGNTCESQLHPPGALDPSASPEDPEVDRKPRKEAKGKDKGHEKGGNAAEKDTKAKQDKSKPDKGAKEVKLENSKNISASPALGPPTGNNPSKPVIAECNWVVTNNKGYCVLQTPFQPPPPEEPVPEPDSKAKKDANGKNKAKGGEEAEKGAKQAKVEDRNKKFGEKDGLKGKGNQANKGKAEAERAEVAPQEVSEGPIDPIMETPAAILVEPKPSVSELSRKRIVHVTDPESEAAITVREDLVILIQPADESYFFVQHADGTQILTQQKEATLEIERPRPVSPPPEQSPVYFCHLHNIRPSGSLQPDVKQVVGAPDVPVKSDRLVGTQQQVTAIVPSRPDDLDAAVRNVLHVPESVQGPTGLGKANPNVDTKNLQLSKQALATVPQVEDLKLFSFSRRKSPNKIILEPPLMEIDQDKGKDCPHCQASWKQVHRPPPLVVDPPPTTTVWHMRKDGLPSIQGKLGEGVAVQIHTYEGHYCVTWSQPTQQLSIMLPNGVLIYTDDKTVFVDTSRGVDQGKPDALLIKKKNREIAINTNGLHAFDLEEGSLYHTDKEGNGYSTQKGSVVEVLVSGLPIPPPSSPKPAYEPVDFLAIEEIPEIIEETSLTNPEVAGPTTLKVTEKVQGKGQTAQLVLQRDPLISVAEAKKESASIGQPTIPQAAGSTLVRRASQAGKTYATSTADPVLQPAGLFTPKLHIPVPPILPPQVPLERHSQWGIKGLPAPAHPPDPQLEPAGHQISTNSAAAVPAPGSGLGSTLDPGVLQNDIGEKLEFAAVREVPGDQDNCVPFELSSNCDLSEMGPPPEYPKLLSTELGPPARIFVAHDGGYGFEICAEKEFAKYMHTKKADPLCHIATEGFYGGEECTTFHTFIRVEDLHKEPYAPFVPKEKNPLPGPIPINPVKKLEALTEKTMAQDKLEYLHQGTKCPWVDLTFEFPVLPRIVAPCRPPCLPCCKETLVSFRRICEYPQFSEEELDKVERALGEFEKWRCEVLEKPLEEWVDPRTDEEITLEREISECVRQSVAEQKIFEAQERGVVDSRYVAGLLRRMRNGEAWRIEQMLREEQALQSKRKQAFQKYMEVKCHATICIHKPDLLQKVGPYRPLRNAILQYWKCEEGLRALLDMLGETIYALDEEDKEEDPDQVKIEEIEILINATKKEAIEIFEELMRLMEVFRNTNLFPKEEEFKFREPEEPPCCFIEWMILIEKYHKKNYPKAYEEEAAERERLRREEYLRMAKVECGKLLENMISETETEYTRLTAYRSPSFHSSEYLRDEFWDELMNLVEDPRPLSIAEVEPMSPNSSITEESHSLFRRKWDTAPWQLNAAYLSVEEAFRIFSYFNSVYLLREKHLHRDRPQQFHLMPGYMNFQKVKHQSTTLQVAYLLNFHDDMGRFKIQKLNECLKVYYKHGPVAPGMLRKIRVLFKALKVGDYKDEVEIITEFDIFKIPVTATVLSIEQDEDLDDLSLQSTSNHNVQEFSTCMHNGPPSIDKSNL